MMLRHTLLYLPAQLIGPLVQLIAVVVWTHLVDEHTLGVITLVTATHELLQVGFLAWWSQYALRFFGRFQNTNDADRFYRTENLVLAVSVALQSVTSIAILLFVIAPGANHTLVIATVVYVITRSLSLYISDRARIAQQIGIYSVQQIVGPAVGFAIGWVMIKLIGPAAEWPLIGYAIAQLAAVALVMPALKYGRHFRPVDREILRQALHYGAPLIIGGALSWVGLNASRFIVNNLLGVAAAGLFAVGYGLGQRAAAVAAMLVTVAAYPIAVKSMEEKGSAAAMRQLGDNGAFLIAIIAPSTLGVFLLRHEIVSLLIAETFRATTLAILPLSVLAGSIRSIRAHFGDQVFLLHNRTRLSAVVMGVDALTTVAFGIAGTLMWGVTGAAFANVGSALTAAIVSFACGLSMFQLQIPYLHLARIGLASVAMGLALHQLPEATNIGVMLAHIAAGATVYLLVLGFCYAPWLLRRFGSRSKIMPAE
jgi:O-antigen/teichoic acid export membrane protein